MTEIDGDIHYSGGMQHLVDESLEPMTQSVPVSTTAEPSKTSAPEETDAVLLNRFIRQRDRDAFSTLVRRHHNLVMAVALRQVGDRTRAEDVYQATFLVFAEQAGTIRNPESLASWLHGTARRIGLRALADLQRQPRSVSNHDPAMSDPVLKDVEDAWQQQTLDEELSRLPEKFREPVVLHYLEGLTGREVAERLGISVDAVESRLRRGREQLRQRLIRRGVGVGLLALAFQMSQQVAEAAATPLLDGTVDAALAWVSQQPLQGCSASAAHLAGKDLAAMTAAKTTMVVTLTAIACLGTGIVGTWALASGLEQPGGKADTGGIDTTTSQVSEPNTQANERTSDATLNSGGTLPEGASGSEGAFGLEGADGSGVNITDSGSDAGTLSLDLSGGQTVHGSAVENLGPKSYAKLSPSRQKIESKLDEEALFGAFDKDTSLEELVNIARAEGLTASLDVQALTEYGVAPDTPIENSQFEGLTWRENLNHVLEPLALTYIIKNGVLVITTIDEADVTLETVIYEVRHLGDNYPAEDVADLLLGVTGDDDWEDFGGNGRVMVIPGGVVVSANQKVHRQVMSLLDQLTEFSARSDMPEVTRQPGENSPGGYEGYRSNAPMYGGGGMQGGGGGLGGGEGGLGGGGGGFF
ncbi:MAG: RNA polymerase sigma factor [Planctomycetaceae bacterium]|nr:RNA polymerase sigma factor [Planctomycetaceae bacterium]